MRYEEQLTNEVLIQDLLYWMGTVGIFVAVVAFVVIDLGLVARRHSVDTVVQKVGGALVGGLAFVVIGLGIWNWQFNQAFGVADPLGEAIKSWWIGGSFLGDLPQQINPEILPNADVQHIFAAFFIGYAAFVVALIHSAAVERLKPLAMMIMAVAIGGIFLPLQVYSVWGPVGPLSNEGVHDFVGVFSYIFVGVWALILAWRVGPRIAAREGAGRDDQPQNWALTFVGASLLFIAIPMFTLGCGFLVPGDGFFGIHGTESGFGRVLLNTFLALCVGAITGLVLSYATRVAGWIMFGPIAAYIAVGAGADIYSPLETLLVGLLAPLPVFAVYKLMDRIGVDEHKVVPLTLGAAIYGALAVGIIGAGTPVAGIEGGLPGFEPGHAEITFGWQVVGILATVAGTAVVAFLTIFAIERTVGLRVSDADQRTGLDLVYWPEEASVQAPVAGGALPGTPAEIDRFGAPVPRPAG